MNSRERVLATLNHEISDRIPVDFGGTRRTGITAAAMYRLRQCLGVETVTRVYDVYTCLAEIDDAVADMVGSDVLRLPTPVALLNVESLADQSRKRWKPYALEDGTPVLVPNDFYPERELNGDLCFRDMEDRRFALLSRGKFQFLPLMKGPGVSLQTLDELETEISKKNPAIFVEKNSRYWEMLQLATSVFSKTSQKALLLEAGPPSPFFSGLGRGDISLWKSRLMEQNTFTKQLLEKWLALWLESVENIKSAVGTSVDVFVLEEDFSEIHTQIEFQMIREFILPLYKKGIQVIREHISPKAKFLWQSPGNILPLVPDLILAGVDALNLVDQTVVNGQAAEVKRDFGKQLTFWGGICSAEELQSRTPEEILGFSRDAMYQLAREGNFVLATSGNILPETPPENILTFFGKTGEI
ncbi:MAG: uroporphyrinogen decarboxylase family protein [Planctomycetia bacterium]|nr:uroporphyrinogen decarboxylase family protein [Planctomycetia bacterium]